MEEKELNKELQDTMKEMLAICEEKDIGAHVILVSKTHGGFQLYFPKWSKAQFETIDNKSMIRFKGTNDEEQAITETINMIQVLQEAAKDLLVSMDELIDKIKDSFHIAGGPKKL